MEYVYFEIRIIDEYNLIIMDYRDIYITNKINKTDFIYVPYVS